MTPRQYSLLLKRYEEAQKHAELQTGILAATFANYIAAWSMSPPKQGLGMKPADFMPSMLAAPRKRRRRPKADNELFNARAKSLLQALRAQGKVVDG